MKRLAGKGTVITQVEAFMGQLVPFADGWVTR